MPHVTRMCIVVRSEAMGLAQATLPVAAALPSSRRTVIRTLLAIETTNSRMFEFQEVMRNNTSCGEKACTTEP